MEKELFKELLGIYFSLKYCELSKEEVIRIAELALNSFKNL